MEDYDQYLVPAVRNLRKQAKELKELSYSNTESKSITVLNLKRKSSDSDYGKDCVVPKPFVGENYEDMVNKMNQYLENLIQEINTPYEECTHCKGWGVILRENN